MSSSTRISDLPENVQLQNPGGVMPPAVETRAPPASEATDTAYVPLNVHVNPYGHPPPPGQQQEHQLPSRDIPMNPLEFQHDAATQPNYIPRPKLTSDYVRDYEQQQPLPRSQRYAHAMEDWYDRLQIPVLVGLLFFIFQMPVFNTFLRNNFTFLTMYNDDGNFNIVGLVFKSVLFGGLFYAMQQFLISFA